MYLLQIALTKKINFWACLCFRGYLQESYGAILQDQLDAWTNMVLSISTCLKLRCSSSSYCFSLGIMLFFIFCFVISIIKFTNFTLIVSLLQSYYVDRWFFYWCTHYLLSHFIYLILYFHIMFCYLRHQIHCFLLQGLGLNAYAYVNFKLASIRTLWYKINLQRDVFCFIIPITKFTIFLLTVSLLQMFFFIEP